MAPTQLDSAKNFRDLLIWRKSHALVLSVYQLTTDFPKHETYGVTGQLQRAAVSVPANIAEGFKRRGKADKARFLNIAQASLEECRYFLILVKDLGYGDTNPHLRQLDEASRLLGRYTRQVLKSL
jgi:four helix bundle protein